MEQEPYLSPYTKSTQKLVKTFDQIPVHYRENIMDTGRHRQIVLGKDLRNMVNNNKNKHGNTYENYEASAMQMKTMKLQPI